MKLPASRQIVRRAAMPRTVRPAAPAGALAPAAQPTMPEDAALYECACGLSFMAAVSTFVTCPTCGHAQLW
jgi:hypothetical protein